jgi:sterol 3beta-glucosyltransferase
MKIILPTIGTRGDVQPYIALALGLGKAGHNVTLASHPCMRGLVESYGVTFAPMGPDIDIGHETAVIRGKSPHWMVGFMRVMKFSFAMLEQSHAGLLELCRGADLVIVSHSAAGRMEADKLGLPTVSVTLMPEAIPVKDPQAPFLKRAVMGLAGAGMGLLMTRPIDRIRQRAGLPPMGPTGITSETLNLIPLSPQIVPPSPLWEPRHRMTGYWFAPAPETWTPPVDLAAFLEAGDPPIVVSLGAMALSGEDSLEAAQITLEAAREAGARAIIQGWDEAMKQYPSPRPFSTPVRSRTTGSCSVPAALSITAGSARLPPAFALAFRCWSSRTSLTSSSGATRWRS